MTLRELLSAAVSPADCVSLTPQFLQKLSSGSTCVPHRLQTINKASLLHLSANLRIPDEPVNYLPSIELKLPSG
jgi:hypothetical protein